MSQRIYKPDGEQLERYLLSNPYAADLGEEKEVSCIQGPIRSGTSVASCMRLMEAAMKVPPDHTGKRRSRWLIVRNSYPDLEASTLKTWLHWFPEKPYGRFYWSQPYVHEVRIGDVEADFHFESFDGDGDIPSLMSREYTGAWINEAQFYSRKFVVTLLSRTGYYPIPDGPKFLQMDMNAPPLGHWIPIMRGDAPAPEEWTESERKAHIRPESWEFLVQPAWFVERIDAQGSVLSYDINPLAENLRIMGEKAVRSLLNGRTKDEIDAELMNRVLIQQAGLPVFPMFVRDVHIAKKPLMAAAGSALHVGLDFGRRPAAIVMQNVGGRWFVLAEFTGMNMAAEEFAPALKAFLARRFPGWMAADGPPIHFWGDPSGAAMRSEVDNRTAFDIFAKYGMHVRAADRGNRRTIRLETMTMLLNRMVHGQPGIVFDPKACPKLTTAMGGAYVYQRKKVSGSPTYHDEPLKNEFSDPVDACIEVLMGGGEGRATVGRTERPKPVSTLRPVDVFSRGRPVSARAGVYRR
jgi:hypothetical protein